ncbi:hypothetical protein F8M41_023009 [Gigaspora margarita]|uniref:Uncharacterized protein n=1 Tax=Gigaspora margarita TaxID=4874 RepID=A0A8H4EHM6_GIGMA|nr:hypothetical protein F8M41_023009 [Gigaspora margarita]
MIKRSNRTTHSYIPVPKFNVEHAYWSSEELLNEETESILTAGDILLNEVIPVDYDESNVESLYEITDSELLSEASVDSDESDTEASTNSVLENMASDFKGFDGEYGPNFSNFTSATIFTWVTKHMRNRLPLAEARQHNVPLCMNKTPSTYEATKKMFTISPLIHLEHILNNPVLMPKMYFGPRIVTKEKREFWHGELWQDSLLFGECEIKNDKDLSNVRSTDNRHIRGNDKELWLVEGESILVEPTNIERRINVWLCNIPEPSELPSENVTLTPPPKHLPVLKILLDIYFDDFGGVGCITADLPQGNDLADVKHHGTNHGCRTCNVSNSQYTNFNYNYVQNARFHQQTEERFTKIESQHSKAEREGLEVEYGLAKPGPLRILKWNRHIQTPQDAYHSMSGKARTLLETTFNTFNLKGESAFLKHWKDIEKPANWYQMPNPL